MSQELMHNIRIFFVEDQPAVLEGLEALLQRTPEGDLSIVGGALHNAPILSTEVKKSQAHVVLVDLVLSQSAVPYIPISNISESWDIEAIKVLRRNCTPDLKIIAYSNWSQLRNESLAAGADGFLSKASTGDEVRQMIRHVMGRVPSPPADRFHLGRITALELLLADRVFVLRGEHASTTPIHLERPSFALLHYLALERQQKMQYWAERTWHPQYNTSCYHMKELAIWLQVSTYHEASSRQEYIDTPDIARWATKINYQLRSWSDNTTKLSLIHVPGSGKIKYKRSHYTIHPIEFFI